MADNTFPAFDRSMFIPFIELNKIRKLTDFGTPTTGEDWGRIGKSEVFDLAFNPQTETKAYIENKNDETTLKSYQVSQAQEIAIDGNDPIYDLMYELAMKFPVGSDAVIPVLLAAPSVRYQNAIDGFRWQDALITIGNLNTVDKKITFTLNLNGDVERGEVTVTDGKFEFTPNVIAGENSDVETQSLDTQQVSTFSAKKATAAKD